ncbi:hypothetical protein [Lentzea sp. NPDC004782]|uniref:hypothetical protein n=1 Tax=Lentzea sp. NPDC004782 TaxID=3154458 RepID=UPI0033B340BD
MVVGVFTQEEITTLRFCADAVVRLAEFGLRGCVWVGGGALGIGRLVPRGPLTDQRLVAIVSDHLPVTAADWEIAWHAVECLNDTVRAARRVAVTLPMADAVVVLRGASDIDAWCRLIGDVLVSHDPHRLMIDGEKKATRTVILLRSLLPELLFLSWCLRDERELVGVTGGASDQTLS